MQRLLSSTIVLAALLYVGMFLVVAGLRAGHPFELEWQEGGMLEHALRVAASEPLYAAPDLTFAAFPYTPLFHYAAAPLTLALGESFLALRAVSIAATLACLVLLFLYARRAASTPLAGVISAGLFAAAYRFGGSWYDVGRVDMLSWALALGGLYVLRYRAGRGAAAASALLFFLAFFAKQTALPLAAALIVPAYLRDRAFGRVFAGVFALAVFGASLAYHLATDGWSTWYWFELLAGHEWFRPNVLGFWRELGLALGPALLAAAIGAAGSRADGARPEPVTLTAAVALVLVAWLGRAHEGGYDNTLIPAALAISLLAGPAAAAALRAAGPLAAGAGVLLLAQFGLLWWDPRAALPTAADVAEGERVVAELRAIEGDVFVPYQSYLARRAGKSPCIHYMAIEDLMKSAEKDPGSTRHARGQSFVDLFARAITGSRYGALVMAERRPDLAPLFQRTYLPPRPLADPTQPEVFAPITGWPARPSWIYLPR